MPSWALTWKALDLAGVWLSAGDGGLLVILGIKEGLVQAWNQAHPTQEAG